MTHWLYKILASVGLKVQEVNWFSVVIFCLLGKEVSRRKTRSFFLYSGPGPSWCFPTCDCGFRPRSELRVLLQINTVEGVRFASNNKPAVSLSGYWHRLTQSHCWAVTFGDLRLVCPSTCFLTFRDSGFFSFLLSFRPTSESPLSNIWKQDHEN